MIINKKCIGIIIGLLVTMNGFLNAAIWEVSGKIGFSGFYAEMNDEKEIVSVRIRLENHAGLKGLDITSHFVQMTDANKVRCRPVAADEIVSDYLDELWPLLPQHQKDIDLLLKEIQADYPQEKIVKVYAKLKGYMKKGRPIQWRAGLENLLLGKHHSSKKEIKQAEIIIGEIKKIADNYFWPGNIPPGENKTGVLYFKRPLKYPATLFIQVGDEFLGLPFEVKKSDVSF